MPEPVRAASHVAIRGRLAALGPAAALLVLVVAVLPGVFGGGALYMRDINMVWLPQVESFVHCVAAGGWPVWDPYSGFGRPLLADPRAEILYPPTWLNLVLGPATYYAAFAVGHLLLAGIGMWRLARHDGLGRAASATAAAVWVACGPVLSLVAMWHHLAAAAWLAWVVGAFDDLVERPGMRPVAAAAGTLGAQVLAGSPDVTVLTLLILLVRGAGPVLCERRGRVGRVGVVAGAAALALALSAAQWLPSLDVVRRSTRWAGGGATTWSVHPLVLLELVVPMRWADMPLTPPAILAVLEGKEPWMRSVYLGAVTACLVAAGLAVRHRRRASLAILVVLSLALAVGDHGPVYSLAAFVPGLRSLRFPVKALLVGAFAWSLLAAAGVEALKEGARRARGAAMAAAATMGVLLVAAWTMAATAAAGHGPLGSLLGSSPPRWVLPPLLPAAALTVMLAAITWGNRRLSPRAVGIALGLLAAGDLAWRHRELNPTAPRALFGYRPEALTALDVSHGARTYVYDYSMDPDVGPRPRPWAYRVARQPVGWTSSAATVLGVHAYLNPPTAARWGVFSSYDLDILGFDPVPADRLARFLREVEGTPGHLRLLQIGAVAQVLALEPAPWWGDLRPVTEVAGFFQDPIQVLRVPHPLPRAYIVDGIRVADGEAALSTLVDAAFDPRREVVLDHGEARAPGVGVAGTAVLRDRGWDTVEVSVDLRRDGHLVMVDAYDPGWKAAIDGEPATVERANVAFNAVAVAAGRHTVTMAYRPRSIVVGLWGSALGLCVAAVLCGAGPAGAARRRAAQAP